jgi:hypothetical protein
MKCFLISTKKYTRPWRWSILQNEVQVLYPRLNVYEQSDTKDELKNTCVIGKNCTSLYEDVGNSFGWRLNAANDLRGGKNNLHLSKIMDWNFFSWHVGPVFTLNFDVRNPELAKCCTARAFVRARVCVCVRAVVWVTVTTARCVAPINCLKFTEIFMKCRVFWDLTRCRRVNNYERSNVPELRNLHKNLHKNMKSGKEIVIFLRYKCQTFISSIDVFNNRQFQYKF